jgi:phage baseplate assembly protein W
VPGTLAAVVDRCLAKRPEDRYASGEALAEALERALAEAPAGARGTGPAFPPGLPERLDEAQAAAIWRRAAQLQADALHRLEARHTLLGHAQSRNGDAGSAAGGTAGYRLADVAGAAEEAGISRQYVALALAELPRGALPAAVATGASDRSATRLLGTSRRSVGVSVVVAAPPARALRALGVVLQQAPYELQLRETVGAHPLDGGVIVFDLPGVIVGVMGAAAGDVSRYWMGPRQQREAHQVQVSLRPAPGEGAGAAEYTEVTMTADLRPGVRRNVRASGWTAGTLGGVSGVFAGAVLAKGAAVAASAAVLGPALGVGAAVAGLSLLGYRLFYPTVLAKAENEMRRALQAVGAAVQSETVFGVLPGPGHSPRAGRGGASGEDTLVVIG